MTGVQTCALPICDEMRTVFEVKENSVCSRLYYQCKRKERGPQFTSGVAPKQINNMLGEHITAGN